VTFQALIADPHGEGRPISYDVLACANQNDLTCSNAWESIEVAHGVVNASNGVDTELSLPMTPGLFLLDGGIEVDGGLEPFPLLVQVLQDDPYHGLAGLLMPVVLHVVAEPVPGSDAGVEEIYAQKLMAFDCAYFPDMKPQTIPVIPSLTFNDAGWPEDAGVGGLLSAAGGGPFNVAVGDVSGLEETYSVIDFNLQEDHLTESWLIDYYTIDGSFSLNETGGADLGGGVGTNVSSWSPLASNGSGTVVFWFTVRNGRGGMSWTRRTLQYSP
jgi:hypothetical protein